MIQSFRSMTWTKDRGAARAPFFSSNVMLPSIIQQNLTKSRICLESGGLEAVHPPPSIPPIYDLSNRFNEAAWMFLFCQPSQLERGSNRRIGRRLARFDPPPPRFTTTRIPASQQRQPPRRFERLDHRSNRNEKLHARRK